MKEDEKEVAGTVESDSEDEGAWALEDDEVSIVSRGASPVSPVSDDDNKITLIFEETDDTKEPDWFERVTCGEEESAVTELYKTDWFDEVAEGEEESDDEVGSSGGVSVEGFGNEALEGAIVIADAATSGSWACVEAEPKDSRITSLTEAVCNVFKDDVGLETLFGSCQGGMQAPKDANFEGESGGISNPCNDATVEWGNHASVLQTTEKETCPLGNRKGEETNNPAAWVCEGWVC